MIKLLGRQTSGNVQKVLFMLEEIKVPYAREDYGRQFSNTQTPEYLALNPNGKVPTLVVDGTPMFECVAIVQWLGDRYGVEKKLWPAFDSPERLTALSCTAWAYVSWGAQLTRLAWSRGEHAAPELHHPPTAEHASRELQHMLGLLDARLAKQPYMLGKDFTLVDSLLANTVRYSTLIGVQTDAHSHLGPWLERCHARPAMRAEWT